jgi:YfiH family protein
MSRSTNDSGVLAQRSSESTDSLLAERFVVGSLPRFELDEWRTRFGVVAGITSRGDPDAPLDFALRQPPEAHTLDRWAHLQEELQARGVVVSRQIHGTLVKWHSGGWDEGVCILEGKDGHGTSEPGLLLAITVADCIPVYLHDPVTRSIALLHAGWRGTAAGVLNSGIELLEARAGARAEDIVMHCGPGICGSCYEVGHEVIEAMARADDGVGSNHLDLRRELTRQGRAAGLQRPTRSAMCTKHHHDSFFSHRGSAGAAGRMVAYMLLLP